MLNQYDILKAMDGIEPQRLRTAADILELGKDQPARFRFPWKAAILAAVLTALFTVTAWSLGWFGLGARSFEADTNSNSVQNESIGEPQASPDIKSYWKSDNGFQGSNEFKANAEWTNFYWGYKTSSAQETDKQFLEGVDQKYTDICHFYGAYNKEMADKLFEIAEQYELKLHYDRLSPFNREDFYAACGTGDFLPDNCSSTGYIYEDGSFRMECFIPETEPHWEDDIYVLDGTAFTVVRHMAGTLVPWFSVSPNPSSCEEWEYINAFGNPVIMSYDSEHQHLIVSYFEDEAFLELSTVLDADDGRYRGDSQRIADLIDFHEAAMCRPDISVIRHGPTVCTEPGTAISSDSFFKTTEGAAMAEYSAACHNYTGMAEPVILPEENQEPVLCSVISHLSEKYKLEVPETLKPLTELDNGEAWKAAGFTEEPSYTGDSVPEYCLSNGCVRASFRGGTVWYIPRGTLCTMMSTELIPPAEGAESWYYKTEHRSTVHITVWSRGVIGQVELKENLIICETPDGWILGSAGYYNSAYELEAFADNINFDAFS